MVRSNHRRTFVRRLRRHRCRRVSPGEAAGAGRKKRRDGIGGGIVAEIACAAWYSLRFGTAVAAHLDATSGLICHAATPRRRAGRLRRGVSELKCGAATLRRGVSELKCGAATLRHGVSMLKCRAATPR